MFILDFSSNIQVEHLGHYHRRPPREIASGSSNLQKPDTPSPLNLFNLDNSGPLSGAPRSEVHIFILSAPRNSDARRTIRETWLSRAQAHALDGALPNQMRVYYRIVSWHFVVGTLALDERSRQELQSEQDVYSDILLLDHLVDSYGNLTEKLLASFVALVETGLQFEYLLKCDDDSFVRLEALLFELENLRFGIADDSPWYQFQGASPYDPQRPLYMGFFRGDAPVQRAGAWREGSWFLADRYLPYAHGGGYLLSASLVAFVARAAPHLQRYANEDVSLGVWLAPLAINRVHSPRFDTEFVSRGCLNAHIVSHKLRADEQRQRWRALETDNVGGSPLTLRMCANESERLRAFRYDWHVPPSRCCIRNLSLVHQRP